MGDRNVNNEHKSILWKGGNPDGIYRGYVSGNADWCYK